MHQARLVGLEQASPSVRLFRIRCDVDSFYRRAGQWINLARELDGTLHTASFSVASSPTDAGTIELAIKHSTRHPLTRWLHEQAQPGDSLLISDGQGDFIWEASQPQRVVLIGAGTGVVPLMSIFRAIAEAATVQATLLYSISSPEEYLFRDEIVRLSSRPGLRHIVTLSQPNPGWQGETGRIGEYLLRRAGLDQQTLYYLCGPQAMVDGTSDLLATLGVPTGHVIYEKWW